LAPNLGFTEPGGPHAHQGVDCVRLRVPLLDRSPGLQRRKPPAQCTQDAITVELNPGGSASISVETVLEQGREGQALVLEAPGVPGVEQVFATHNINLPGKLTFTLRVQPGSSPGTHHRLIYKINDSDDNVFDEVTILLNIV
jgi:hypothetical protein